MFRQGLNKMAKLQIDYDDGDESVGIWNSTISVETNFDIEKRDNRQEIKDKIAKFLMEVFDIDECRFNSCFDDECPSCGKILNNEGDCPDNCEGEPEHIHCHNCKETLYLEDTLTGKEVHVGQYITCDRCKGKFKINKEDIRGGKRK